MIFIGWIVVGLAVAGCASTSSVSSSSDVPGLNGSSVSISKSSWQHGRWPFTVPGGILGCTQPPFPGAVTFNVDGTLYAINGTAEDAHMGRDVGPIWKKAPGGLRVDIGGVIDEGLNLCPG